ncbi:MAG TPA: hypothetical protein V6D47_08015 [Oscillatoriaceae cyanobacterium]
MSEQQATVANLREALKFFLEDDNMIDRLEASALKDLLLQDGKIDAEEKKFLQAAIQHSNFDSQALGILERLLEDA